MVAADLYVYEELPQQYAYRGPGLLLDVPEPMIADFPATSPRASAPAV